MRSILVYGHWEIWDFGEDMIVTRNVYRWEILDDEGLGYVRHIYREKSGFGKNKNLIRRSKTTNHLRGFHRLNQLQDFVKHIEERD